MRYRALAVDYDGTIARHGLVDDRTVAGLQRAKSAGIRLIMVTGRELDSLFDTCPHTDLFDRIVAENGAVLYRPEGDELQVVGEAPPADFVRALTAADVPFHAGHSIIATVEPHESVVLQAIRDLGLHWHVIFNKGAVMALPSSVSKATGFVHALSALDIEAGDTVGVGDAENDHAFLDLCGCAVAVANALPAVKARARVVTVHSHGAGVVEAIDLILSDRLEAVSANGQGPRQPVQTGGDSGQQS